MSDAWVVALVGGTAATVVGGLLIDPARRFLRRVWHRVIAVVRVGARVVWRGLAGSVPVWVVLGVVAAWGGLTGAVPTAVWVMLAAAAVVALARWVASIEIVATVHLSPAPSDPATPEPAPPPALGRIENVILRLLVQADGSLVHFDDLAQAAQERRLRVQPAVERLVNLGLIHPHEDPTYGLRLSLTRRGRDVLIARGDV